MSLNPAVQSFEANRAGRDFVVGDIHGEFARLHGRLRNLDFSAETDRVFSVGDLVDRGPDSTEALRWLGYPWFHAVLGNHEAMLIDATVSMAQLQWWLLANGGEWWLELEQELRERFRAELHKLPLACEVATTAGGRIGIVHADIPPGLSWDQFTQRLESDLQVQRYALWSRERIYGDSANVVRGVDEVYCGHTPVATPLTLGNVHFIDTGACFGGPLSVFPIGAGVRSEE